MQAKTTFLLGLLLAFGVMPLSNAGHQPNGSCINQEQFHTYDEALSTFTTSGGELKRFSVKPAVMDACETSAGVYDGETEYGVGGGRFAAGTAGEHCDWVATSHHAYGVGAQYWADDGSGLAAIAYWAGADGPALVQVTGCETDGILSDDPVTDPLDCGVGSMGAYAAPNRWTPTTLDENVRYSGACNPFDGFVWVFLAYGVDIVDGFVSTPIEGHIWS